MNRTTPLAARFCTVLGAAVVFSGPRIQAQELAVEAPPNPASVAGAPFSAVATQQITREFADGNRMTRTVRVTHYYRDSAGRTRIERELSRQNAGAQATLQEGIDEIDDPVTGERYLLNPHTHTASVFKGRTISQLVQPPFTPPGITAYYGGLTIGPKDQGWSQPEPLGEQTIEGVTAVGTRRQYTLAAGALGNEKPIGITIEQWFSPDLGMIVSKTGRATTGGTSSYRLEHIVKGDPDPVLFTIPAEYTRQESAIASN
jgi:hypothetical protein